MSKFDEVSFPLDIAIGASASRRRRAEIVTLASGREERTTPWINSRRRYDAGVGVRDLDDMHTLLDFFEARRGPVYGFRFRDYTDWKSCPPLGEPSAADQALAAGDGITKAFQLRKTYGAPSRPYVRAVTKPVAGTVLVAVNGAPRTLGAHYTLDAASGIITFVTAPAAGASVTAGFEFDVPVRFDTEEIEVNLSAFEAGEVPSIPLIEIRP